MIRGIWYFLTFLRFSVPPGFSAKTSEDPNVVYKNTPVDAVVLSSKNVRRVITLCSFSLAQSQNELSLFASLSQMFLRKPRVDFRPFPEVFSGTEVVIFSALTTFPQVVCSVKANLELDFKRIMRQSSQERIAPVRCELRKQPSATETLILVSLTSTKPDSNESRHPLIRHSWPWGFVEEFATVIAKVRSRL